MAVKSNKDQHVCRITLPFERWPVNRIIEAVGLTERDPVRDCTSAAHRLTRGDATSTVTQQLPCRVVNGIAPFCGDFSKNLRLLLHFVDHWLGAIGFR